MKTLMPALLLALITAQSASLSAAESTPFASESLDNIELPSPGHFRLVIDGQRFDGEATGQHGLPPVCRADAEYHPSNHVKTFQFAQTIPVGDGRYLRLEMSRMLSRLEASWNRFMGHENDQVEVTLMPDARSRLMVRRVRPGEESYRVGEVGSSNAGPYDLPLVRFVRGDQLAATAIGQLHALNEHPDALTGAFELAVVCP